MKLSDGEKLILVMLSELYEKLGIECVFHGFLPPSPEECCHAIHGNVATQSRGFLPPSPRNVATLGA